MAPPTPSCHPPRPRALWRSLAGREGVRGPLRPRAGARYLQLWATLRAPLIFQPWHPRLPRRPAAPAGGGDAGGGGQFTLISGTLLLDSAGGIPKSPQREVAEGVGMAGGVRLGGGAGDAGRHLEGTDSRPVSVAPPHAPPRPHLPPPAGTSGFADWLMCPWKWLFKKLSQARKIVISPSSQTLVELSSFGSIMYCGPAGEETQ